MKQKAMVNKDVLVCECNSVEHSIVLFWDSDNNEIYMYIHLRPFNFWMRLVNGIKYIFGHRSRYGDFDEFIFNPDDAPKLKKIVEHLESQTEKKNIYEIKQW